MESTLPELFAAAARRHADRPAVIHGGGVASYAELAAGVDAFAARLQELGLAGRRIAVLLPNLPVFPLVFYGALRAGCRVLLLNPLNSPREVAEYTDDAGVRDVVTLTPLLGLLPPGSRALLADALPGAFRVFAGAEDREVPLAGARDPHPVGADAHAEAVVMYTAANRGWARGAVLAHRSLVANLRSTREAMGITAEDRVVAPLPMIHAFGLTVSLNATLAAGAALIPVERFHPLRTLELLEEEGVTMLSGVPAMYIGLLGAAERRGRPAHSLRVAICGGAPLDPAVSRRWEEVFGLPLRQGYGLTEAGPVCLFNRVDRPNRLGTLGYPFSGVDVSVRDPDGQSLPAPEVGELCVRGDNVFDGYLGDDGRSGGDFHGDWLRTGDLASEEEDGAFRFRGVLKPMFTRNGFNVYPAELERVLQGDPRVARARVAALPSPTRENDIVLHVEPAAGARLTEDDVRDFCRAHLAAYKQPTRIEIAP